jgi:hypothetical protein
LAGLIPAVEQRLTFAVEHQAHLAEAVDIEVLADHPLEEDAPRHLLVEHPG